MVHCNKLQPFFSSLVLDHGGWSVCLAPGEALENIRNQCLEQEPLQETFAGAAQRITSWSHIAHYVFDSLDTLGFEYFWYLLNSSDIFQHAPMWDVRSFPLGLFSLLSLFFLSLVHKMNEFCHAPHQYKPFGSTTRLQSSEDLGEGSLHLLSPLLRGQGAVPKIGAYKIKALQFWATRSL